ncbi:hypothetical protein OEIGOIKO_00092 [Streptomyces chrestomyceticus JCM 4735]|uniref:DUF4158 domain-containing protein n=1 Tax=Streptomyces chrestomyceticus JCM 4735 TaxID=1306181 RepID=A0A7U9PVK1_9ACTN|nr:DUF4158 domain-containing protein [Streptomyces chrestomyceticus]GCD32380.1 hypothetical protein OEIGOIKO_00092 [Streptomyces chrestomyceticus JCM 4735]
MKRLRACSGTGCGPARAGGILSDEQAEAYGTSAEEPTRPELKWFFFPDDVDRRLIALRRTEHHQLGSAFQMCPVRCVGLFLEDTHMAP